MTEHRHLGKGTFSYRCMGDGPLVILSHALGPRVWDWPLERLAASCTVAALESFPAPAAVFPQVARALGHDSFSLCAWLMAGGEALSYAASHPPELERLILVDIAGLGGLLSEGGE